ncbi:MAG: hypothetical protein IAE80_21875 [Anaerolinea sp.]|nr:hypothetical protein [Anaerolinea sp.]
MFLLALMFLAGCGAAVAPIVPTAQPTATITPTEMPSRTPARNVTPTQPPTLAPATATGGPSPTPLFGQASTAAAFVATATRPLNPNAPRIEFFTAGVAAVAPGDSVTLYWSTRGTTAANIYRLERGVRNQVWQVEADGNLTVPTRRSDRGSLEFLLTAGDGDQRVEQTLTIPLACPDVWFFQPPPESCPTGAAQETYIIEEPFQTGRMIYIQLQETVYSLFNDGFAPGWVAIEDRFNPAVHPESEASFAPPPGLYQPLRRLGFVWRGNDTVRSRLGLATQPEFAFDGFVQTSATNGVETIYVSSADGTVLQLLPQGEGWQIITPP